MPIYHLNILDTTTVEHQRAILDSLHYANIGSGFPENDRFQRN
ncbi:hypothetical protein [Mastigocladopsis repens]|nr:hypothetical protein [Mastigocladopsis repens]